MKDNLLNDDVEVEKNQLHVDESLMKRSIWEVKSQLLLLSANPSIPEMVWANTNDLIMALAIRVMSYWVQNLSEKWFKWFNQDYARPVIFPATFWLWWLYQKFFSSEWSGVLSDTYTFTENTLANALTLEWWQTVASHFLTCLVLFSMTYFPWKILQKKKFLGFLFNLCIVLAIVYTSKFPDLKSVSGFDVTETVNLFDNKSDTIWSWIPVDRIELYDPLELENLIVKNIIKVSIEMWNDFLNEAVTQRTIHKYIDDLWTSINERTFENEIWQQVLKLTPTQHYDDPRKQYEEWRKYRKVGWKWELLWEGWKVEWSFSYSWVVFESWRVSGFKLWWFSMLEEIPTRSWIERKLDTVSGRLEWLENTN